MMEYIRDQLKGIEDLNERRTIFIYEAAALAALAAKAPVIPALWENRETPFKKQMIAAVKLICEADHIKTAKELHNDWWQAYIDLGWSCGPYDPKNKTHPDMIPYEDLGHLERDKDAVFALLCEIARDYIYE